MHDHVVGDDDALNALILNPFELQCGKHLTSQQQMDWGTWLGKQLTLVETSQVCQRRDQQRWVDLRGSILINPFITILRINCEKICSQQYDVLSVMTSWSLWLARKRGFWPHEVNNSQSLGLSQREAALGEREELGLAWPHHQNCFIHPIALSTDNDILYSKLVKGLLFEIQEIRIDSIDSTCLRLHTTHPLPQNLSNFLRKSSVKSLDRFLTRLQQPVPP